MICSITKNALSFKYSQHTYFREYKQKKKLTGVFFLFIAWFSDKSAVRLRYGL